MTAEISSSVAENAVCWCEGWKKRRSFFIETRSERSILSESQAVRQLSGGHSRPLPFASFYAPKLAHPAQ
jgi:hypothetical protein